ncbi:MAG: LpqB family beta-propeller domain-containing protein [Trueperella sp.]|nr:LpqB family beta-propeller domain-containing protein [Trueperella sp.]
MNKAVKILSVIAGVLLLAGCSSLLPVSGAPQAVPFPENKTSEVTLNAQGPTKGASAEELITGFLRASAAGVSEDFAVARQFLTPEAAASWDPTAQVRLYPDNQSPALSRSNSGAVRISVAAMASLDKTGTLTTAAADSVISGEFSLVRNADGEWRIAVLDDGITVPAAVFQSQFEESVVYYLTVDRTALVPTVRWFPRNSAPTLAAEALIAGPPAWLSDAVGTAVPVGTTLATPTVKVEDGVATVDLSAAAAQITQNNLDLLYAQFTKTLTGLRSVQGVRLSAVGAELRRPNRLDLPSYPYSSYALLVLQNGVPARVTETQVEPLVAAPAVTGLGLTAIASGYTEEPRTIVGLGKDGLYRIAVGSAEVTQLIAGTALVAPSVDSYGWAWTGVSNSAGILNAVDIAGGAGVMVPANWLNGAQLQSLHVSREGTRMVVVYRKDDATSLGVAAIQRDETGRPLKLGEVVPLGQRLAEITDLAWIAESELIVLARSKTGSELSLQIVTIGATPKTISAPDNPVALTGGLGLESVVLVAKNGSLFRYDGGAWRVVATEVTAPALPG